MKIILYTQSDTLQSGQDAAGASVVASSGSRPGRGSAYAGYKEGARQRDARAAAR